MLQVKPDDDRLSHAEVDAQLRGLSGADWKRARSIASLVANGLNGWTGDDLLHEAAVVLLQGERVWHRDVHVLVTLKMAMRSIASNARKKVSNGPVDHSVAVDIGAGRSEDYEEAVAPVNYLTPERIADGRQQLAEIEALVTGDEDAEMVLMAWCDGIRGQEAMEVTGMDAKRYDAARKRLLRKLAPVAALRSAG